MKDRLLEEYIRSVLREYWAEPAGGVTRNSTTTWDPPMVPRSSSVSMPGTQEKQFEKDPEELELEGEADLMLDRPGTIVEPDVRKKIRNYFRSMKLTPTRHPGKTFK